MASSTSPSSIDKVSRTIAIVALVASLASGGGSIWSAYTAHEALRNANPSINITTELGSVDKDGNNFAAINGKKIAFGTIKSGNFWLSITVKNGGGRAILIDSMGIETSNGAVFYGSQFGSGSDCNSSQGQFISDMRCSNAFPFSVSVASADVFFFPLTQACDMIQGGNGGKDAELKIKYSSSDVYDKGKSVGTGYIVTSA